MAEFASRGGAYGVGIPALALGGLAFLQNGGLGNIFGGGNAAAAAAEVYATKTELGMAKEVAERDHTIAALQAEKYTDEQVKAGFAREAKINEDIKNMAVTNERNIALLNADVACLKQRAADDHVSIATLTTENANARVREQHTADMLEGLATSTSERFTAVHAAIHAAKTEMGGAIALESERRLSGQQNLMNYVNATFVPGKLVMPADNVCPQPMAAKNAWVSPECACPSSQQG